MLAENPPPAHHAILLKQFAEIGIGPGLDVEQQPEVVKEALQRAAAKGMLLLRQQFMSGVWATIVNGWRYPPPDEGRFGDKFLMRAADQSLVGVTANDPEEAVYLVNLTDDHGEPLTGAHKYELTFPAGMTPPVDAFWSLTVYGTDYNLVPNPINRYSIGDRTPGSSKMRMVRPPSTSRLSRRDRIRNRTGCRPAPMPGSPSCACICRILRSSTQPGSARP